MRLHAPRHAVVLHLRRDQRTRGLGGEQQPQATGLVGTGDGRELALQLLERIVDLRRPGVVEQAALDRRRNPRAVPGAGRCRGKRGRLRVHAPPQDRVAEPQVVAPLESNSRGQQRRVAARRVVPHPPRTVRLALADDVDEVLGGDGDRAAHALTLVRQ